MEWDREKGEKNRYMVIGRMDGQHPCIMLYAC